MQRREHMPEHLKLKKERGNKATEDSTRKYDLIDLIVARWLL